MVKVDRRLWQETLTSLIAPALFFGLGSWIFNGILTWQVFLGVGALWYLRGVIQAARDFKRLLHVERRRRAAANRAQWVPLAFPQPSPGPSAFSLPLVVSSQPGWLMYLLAPCLIWVCILFVLGTWFLFFGKSVTAFALVPALEKTAALTVPLSILAYLTSYEWIEAREEGLTIRTPFRRRTIPWQEARLFAIDATEETNKAPDKYELSSAMTILRWQREKKHAQQMDTLLALIAAKTGLPLYDLRDWKLPPLPAPPEPQYVNLWRGE